MHPPHINSKSQLENFGRHFFFSQIYFFFLLRKTSIGEVWTFDGNQEDFTLKGHSRTEFLHLQKLWLRVWATRWDNHTTAAKKIPPFVLPQGSSQPIMLCDIGRTRKTLLKNGQTFFLKEMLYSMILQSILWFWGCFVGFFLAKA